MRPLARARVSNSWIAAFISGEFTSAAFTTTVAGSAAPGNAACMRS